MFYEKGDSGSCYKSFAKWDIPFDKEQVMNELIAKHNLLDCTTDSKESKASS